VRTDPRGSGAAVPPSAAFWSGRPWLPVQGDSLMCSFSGADQEVGCGDLFRMGWLRPGEPSSTRNVLFLNVFKVKPLTKAALGTTA